MKIKTRVNVCKVNEILTLNAQLRNHSDAYMCVSDCFFKQSSWYYALADYRQAEEMMQPNDPAVRLRLAVIYNTLGSLCFQDGSEPHGEHPINTHTEKLIKSSYQMSLS